MAETGAPEQGITYLEGETPEEARLTWEQMQPVIDFIMTEDHQVEGYNPNNTTTPKFAVEIAGMKMKMTPSTHGSGRSGLFEVDINNGGEIITFKTGEDYGYTGKEPIRLHGFTLKQELHSGGNTPFSFPDDSQVSTITESGKTYRVVDATGIRSSLPQVRAEFRNRMSYITNQIKTLEAQGDK